MASHMANLSRATLIRNPHHKRNGLKSYVHALKKYGIGPTVEGPYVMIKKVQQQGKFSKKVGGKAHVQGHILAKKDATTGQTGDVPAEDVDSNAEYLAAVQVGTPGQKLNLDFDTGSADLWVFSTELPSSEQKSGTTTHNIFDSSKSTTWKETTGSTWNISYGDGSTASGDVGTDVLTIGGLVVKDQAIELAKTLSTSFASGPGDGLLGLAWGSINTVTPTPVQTPVENMITQSDIPQSAELFTAFLGDTTENSFYTFGYIDQTATGGVTPSYAKVDNSQGFWMFDSTTASINGKSVDRPSGNTSIADTGTTLCLIDDATCKAIYAAIPGSSMSTQQQGYVFPTSTALDKLPVVELAVGDTLFQINKENFAFQDLGDGTSYGGIQSRGDQNFDIYGDVFLRSVYAIFDQGNTQFGCVQRESSSSSSSSGSTATGSGSTSAATAGAQEGEPHKHHHHHKF
ncbi:hypothetical protein LTR36_001624 [Oleoguttula mirabilis]|uniref:Peptidase A1 domain-containing protein n=1 Tax=Oleoguttula mirabilis TaxID=1507867 RepID=A0AAV9JNE6_9PEZI|nr:hypothetical protein LTR36_001624 [Oleoguttula mirabilis]